MRSTYGSIIPLLVFTAMLCSCSEKVELNDLDWAQEGSTCLVSFSVKNTQSEPVSRMARIIAQHQEIGTYGTVVFDIVGEKEIRLDLGAGEEKQIKETLRLKMNLRPSTVTLKLSDCE